jgi:hypothetical protein
VDPAIAGPTRPHGRARLCFCHPQLEKRFRARQSYGFSEGQAAATARAGVRHGVAAP